MKIRIFAPHAQNRMIEAKGQKQHAQNRMIEAKGQKQHALNRMIEAHKSSTP